MQITRGAAAVISCGNLAFLAIRIPLCFTMVRCMTTAKLRTVIVEPPKSQGPPSPGAGLFTLSRAVTTKIHETIKRRRRTGVDLTLDCVNYGKYISVSSESGPVVNLTPNGCGPVHGIPDSIPRRHVEAATSGDGVVHLWSGHLCRWSNAEVGEVQVGFEVI